MCGADLSDLPEEGAKEDEPLEDKGQKKSRPKESR